MYTTLPPLIHTIHSITQFLVFVLIIVLTQWFYFKCSPFRIHIEHTPTNNAYHIHSANPLNGNTIIHKRGKYTPHPHITVIQLLVFTRGVNTPIYTPHPHISVIQLLIFTRGVNTPIYTPHPHISVIQLLVFTRGVNTPIYTPHPQIQCISYKYHISLNYHNSGKFKFLAVIEIQTFIHPPPTQHSQILTTKQKL